MVLFANAPRLHRDAMAAALSERGREAGVAIPEGWSIAEAVSELQPSVVVVSGSPEQARVLSTEITVAHLDDEPESVLTTYVGGSQGDRHEVSSFAAIAERLEALAEAGRERGPAPVVRL
jgi:hypothetical protein